MTLYFDPTSCEVSLSAGGPSTNLTLNGRLGADLPVKIVVTDSAFNGAQSNEFQFIAKRAGDALGPAAVQETDFIQFGTALQWSGHLALRGPMLAELVDGNNAVTLDAQLQLVLTDKVLVSQMFALNIEPTLFAMLDGVPTATAAPYALLQSPGGTIFRLSVDNDGVVTTVPN